ncbi:MAG: hypothetical protein ACRDE8_17755 [Ginsengibacter sp.]
MDKKYTVFNGCMLYTTAFLLTLIIHETGHFAVEKLYGFNAVMHANYGSYSGNASDAQKIIIAAAGPVTSLIQGFFFLFVTNRIAFKNKFSLFALWFSLHGFILFFGYLVCSPFFIYGDTGQVFHLLHFPFYLTILFSIAGVILLVYTLKTNAKKFTPYGKEIEDMQSRSRALLLYPLIIGGALSLLLQLPVPDFLLLFDGITSPFVFLIVYDKLKNTNAGAPSVSLNKVSIPLVIAFVFTGILVRILM